MRIHWNSKWLLMLTCVPGCIRADEGRIPIYKPTTISAPGAYVVTRDISVAGGVVVAIQANNVTVDLAGRTVSSSSTTDPLIQIGDGFKDVSIRNGRLSGGSRGISYDSPGLNPARIRVESVQILNSGGTGIWIVPGGVVEILSCLVNNPGSASGSEEVGIYFPSTNGTGKVIDNKVVILNATTDGIVGAFKGGEVRGNSVMNSTTGTAFPSWGIGIGGNSVLIEGNQISGGGYSDGALSVAASGSLIRNNTLKPDNGNGIAVAGVDNTISGNTVNPATGNGFGIYISSVGASRNLIDGNLSEGSACGIAFPLSTMNVYRNNLLRGNATAVCTPAGGFNAGGNVCDAGFCP